MSKFNDTIKTLLKKGDFTTEKTVIQYNRELVKHYQNALKGIKDEISKLYAKYPEEIANQTIGMQRLDNLKRQIETNIRKLADESLNTTKEVIKEVYQYNFDYTAFAVQKTLNVNLGFGLVDENKIISALVNPYDKIGWHNTTKQNIQKLNSVVREKVVDGIIQGKAYTKVSKELINQLNIATNKSMRIVRTESHRAQNLGRLHAFEKSERSTSNLGFKTYRVWVSGGGKNPREMHADLNDVRADENGLFYFADGVSTEAPGQSGVAEHDINCQCTTRLEIAGYSSAGRDNDFPDTFQDYISEN